MPMKPAAPESTAPMRNPNRHQPAEEVRKNEKDHDADNADRGVLPLEIRLRALAHRGRDLLHPRVARVRREHGTSRPRGVDDGEHATKDDQPESRHCRNPGFVKRTGQEDLCTVAAAPSPIGRPKPRPKVARTLPKTALATQRSKMPGFIEFFRVQDRERQKAASREAVPGCPLTSCWPDAPSATYRSAAARSAPPASCEPSLSISRQVSHST